MNRRQEFWTRRTEDRNTEGNDTARIYTKNRMQNHIQCHNNRKGRLPGTGTSGVSVERMENETNMERTLNTKTEISNTTQMLDTVFEFPNWLWARIKHRQNFIRRIKATSSDSFTTFIRSKFFAREIFLFVEL